MHITVTLSGMKILLTFSALLILGWQTVAAPVKGIYNGLFSETATNSQQSCGAITISTTAKGKFTGKLQIASTRASFSGVFNNDGSASATIRTRGGGSLKLELLLDTSSAARFISGTISDGKWTAQVFAERVAFDGKTTLAPQTGRYTVVIPQTHGATNCPAGGGYGTIVVSKAGRVKFAGSLADGTKVSLSTSLSSDGSWPCYISLYGGQGSVMGWNLFLDHVQTDVAGSVTWIKPVNAKSKNYLAGFTNETSLVGSVYRAPASGAGVVGFTSGEVTLGGGNLDKPIVNQVSIDSKGRVKNPGGDKLTLSFSPSQGTFRGKITPPGSTKPVSFAGVVMQSIDVGNGYFLLGGQSGFVQITGPLPDALQLQTLGSSLSAEVDLADVAPQEFLWFWSDGTLSSNYPVATKDFGSDGARNQTLNVSPAGLIEGINLGFDGSDGATNAPITFRDQQNVGAVYFAAPLRNLRYWASSYNPITNTLDFTGFVNLQEIECFHCTNLQHVAVANLPSVRRLCFEACDLQELDISGNPNLEDLRAAINGPNAYTEIKIGGGTGPKIWHFCVRDNPQITQDFQTILTNFYSLKEPWFWNTHQSGALKFVSTNLTDVEVQGNYYTFADLGGQANLQFFWADGNQLTNVVLSGCTRLQDLRMPNNLLPRPILDNLLKFLDTSCPDLQFVDLSSNFELPSALGYQSYTNLINRGVSVLLDFP